MSLLIANPIHASSNDMHINDFEIEDILSNMDSFISEENMLFLPTTEDAIDGFAPVSPDHVDAFSEDESRPKTPTGFQVPNPLSIPAPVSPPESPKPVFKVEVRAVKPKLTKKQATDKQANAKNRKRKISSVSSNAETKELTEEELQGRRLRNCEHAKRSRQRKKTFTQDLQKSVDDLKNENQKLREQIYAMIGRSKANAIMAEGRNRSREAFLTALKQPENRVVDDSTLSFLKGLRKNLASHRG